MGLIALLITILLIPLETLGWWAGWYGDPVQATAENSGSLQEQRTGDTNVSHYVVYLDGIGQSTFEYLPEIDVFLDELAHVLPDDIPIRGLYVEGQFVARRAEGGPNTTGQAQRPGFLIEALWPLNFVTTGTFAPPSNWSIDITWEP